MSTRPRTKEGKKRSAMRGFKGAKRKELRAVSRALKELRQKMSLFFA